MHCVILRHQAERLQVEDNCHLPADQKLTLKFSKGWLDRFQKRHGLKFRRVHAEGLGADSVALTTALPEIRSQMSEYETKEVWNADEFGLFYRQLPGSSLSQKQHSGFKKDKTRITFLGCCKSDGSEKYPLMIFGNSLRRRLLKEKYGHEVGFEYYANKKAWVTRELFFAWLKRFDRCISRTHGRKVILFIDICSVHGSEEVLPEVQKVDVRFVPPNTTSRLQPLDGGVIATVKANFWRPLLFRVFEDIDVGKHSIYSIDILTAMRWVKEEREMSPNSGIANSSEHCFGTDTNVDVNQTNEVGRNVREQMAQDLYQHRINLERVGIDRLLSPIDEESII